MTDPFKMLNDGFNKISKSVNDELGRVGREAERNWNADVAQIDNGIKKGGLLGGIVETADVFSPGHQTAQWLDNFNVIPDDEGMKEGISAGVNLFAGLTLAAATGGTAAPFLIAGGGLLALKDVGDMMATPGVPGAAAHSTPSPKEQLKAAKEKSGLVYVSKKDALKDAKAGAAYEAAKAAAIEKAKDKAMVERARRSGYAEGFEDGISAADGLGSSYLDLLKRLRESFGKDKTDEVESEIDKILSNPNLSFEDMIFMLLRAVLKEGQAEAKQLTKDLRNDRQEEIGLKKELNGKIDGLTKKIANEKDPSKKNAMQNELQNLREQKAELLSERAESRADIAESLKNLMQKLSEMQQAMSNILNSQHESAMAAIRNIR